MNLSHRLPHKVPHTPTAGDGVQSASDGRFLVYGHWFVLYAARLLLSRSGKAAPTKGGVSNLVLEALDLVARACRSSKASHYQMFRSSKTKDRILAEFGGPQMSLFDLLAALPD